MRDGRGAENAPLDCLGAPLRSAAAVLVSNGARLHAEQDDGVVEAREDLRRATLAFDRARTTKTDADIELAARGRRPPIGARWSLLDAFDSDGRRFIIAIENAPEARARRKGLSERELQIMRQVQAGHTDKEIAYELGLAVSTVRVLVHRATRKLGAATRREALARFDTLVKERSPATPKG